MSDALYEVWRWALERKLSLGSRERANLCAVLVVPDTLSTWEVSRLQLCIHTTTIVCRTSVLSAVCRGEQIKELVGVVFSLGFSSVVVHQACAPETNTRRTIKSHHTTL